MQARIAATQSIDCFCLQQGCCQVAARVESGIDTELLANSSCSASLPPCSATSCCQGGWRGPGKGPHVWEEKRLDAKWPKEALGAPCTHTFPSSTAVAGCLRGRMLAGMCLHWQGMLTVPAVGISILQGSSVALKCFPPGDLGVPARAGASLSLCGTLCGRAHINPQPRHRAARGSGGQSAPVPTAGPHRCR